MKTKLTAPTHRVWLVLIALLFAGCAKSLRAPYQEADTVQWYDDYYTIEYIDPQTIAIGEPRYHQQNYSYLILGEKRALLFDTGPGVRDIRPVIDSLTDLPLTVTQSHFHYDHVGNHHRFKGVSVADLPALRERAEAGTLELTTSEHLGFVESIDKPDLVVSEWLPIDSYIDLGGRMIKLVHAPGHTRESVVLVDEQRNLLFTGDFVCPGPNADGLPGSDINEYLATARKLLAMSDKQTRLLTGHRDEASVKFGAPVLPYQDLEDVEAFVAKMVADVADGEGLIFKSYKINDRIELVVIP